jgi:hypothetical protein
MCLHGCYQIRLEIQSLKNNNVIKNYLEKNKIKVLPEQNEWHLDINSVTKN